MARLLMIGTEEGHLYDATLVISFAAEDIDDADEQIDRLMEELEIKGFEVQVATVEESVALNND